MTVITDHFLREEATVLEAFQIIDRNATGLACVVDGASRLVGVVTDGDLRRSLLQGAQLASSIAPYIQRAPATVTVGTPRAHILDQMTALSINAIPEISEDRSIIAIHTLSEIVGGDVLPNRAVIMAGGKGTRLGELTRHTPKPLMRVAGRPIIEWVILQLVGSGIRDISISVNHFADQIVTHLGDGKQLGCSIEYLRESPDNPLGTAGSLTLLDEDVTADTSPALIVLNADILVEFDARAFIESHRSSSADIAIGVKPYHHQVPFGVVETDPRQTITGITEKPDLSVTINTGIYCIKAGLVRMLPYNRPSTMPELAQLCLDAGKSVKAWDIESDWIDIGTPNDLARAQGGTP